MTTAAGRLRTSLKTVGTLGLIGAALPPTLGLTAVALLRSLVVPVERQQPAAPKTILLSGGKMTKALQLARTFHTAGHRVILVETAKYRLSGHRFSRAVDQFYTVPAPDSTDYGPRLLEIVLAEHVDVYIPVCSPAASEHDARIAPLLSEHCEVFHLDYATVRELDDKEAFSRLAAGLGLPVPRAFRVTDQDQVLGVDFEAEPGPYVLKNLGYDPVHRLDLTPVPGPTVAATTAFVDTLPIGPEQPWIMQAFVTGQEYCTHTTARAGKVQAYGCCESSAFQINYAMVDKPRIEAWVRQFVGELELTGQISFDFIEDHGGEVWAIECNPRTHSAITMFHDQPALAAAYLERDVATVYPGPGSRPTYWTYHELWRILSRTGTLRERVRVLREGTDAVFDWNDPLPFLLLHHLQIPALLLHNLRRGKDWIRIDFNIGKLVEGGGD